MEWNGMEWKGKEEVGEEFLSFLFKWISYSPSIVLLYVNKLHITLSISEFSLVSLLSFDSRLIEFNSIALIAKPSDLEDGIRSYKSHYCTYRTYKLQSYCTVRQKTRTLQITVF